MTLETFKAWWDFLEGKKTNIIGTVLVVIGVLYVLGIIEIDVTRLKGLLVILNGAGLITLRMGMKHDKK